MVNYEVNVWAGPAAADESERFNTITFSSNGKGFSYLPIRIEHKIWLYPVRDWGKDVSWRAADFTPTAGRWDSCKSETAAIGPRTQIACPGKAEILYKPQM